MFSIRARRWGKCGALSEGQRAEPEVGGHGLAAEGYWDHGCP